jgi:hypothetical protein
MSWTAGGRAVDLRLRVEVIVQKRPGRELAVWAILSDAGPMTVRAWVVVLAMVAGFGCKKTQHPLVGEWKEISSTPTVTTLRADGTYSMNHPGLIDDKGKRAMEPFIVVGNWRTGTDTLILESPDGFDTCAFAFDGDFLKTKKCKHVSVDKPGVKPGELDFLYDDLADKVTTYIRMR